MTPNEMQAILREVEAALGRANGWIPCSIDVPRGSTAEAFTSEAFSPEGAWHFYVVRFTVRDTRGLREGFDGAAMRGISIMRFTPELAEKAYKLATERRKT